MLFPIEELIKGRGNPLCVKPDTKLSDALTLMVKHDYSQLPIVDDRGRLRGIVSENSIVRTYFHSRGNVALLDLPVNHFSTPAPEISPGSDIFEALNLLRSAYAVVVVENQEPVGILTNYDTTYFFRDTTQGLIIVEDIETTLREYIEAVFPDEHTMTAGLYRAFGGGKQDPLRPKAEYERLSFYQHIRLITADENWKCFGATFAPKDLFCSLMAQVNEIRNQLAHFRGDLDQVQYDGLVHARDWLSSRPRHVLGEASDEAVEVTPSATSTKSTGGKYATLEAWLQEERPRRSLIRINFDDIEQLIGDSLPESARQHRSWWSNSPTTHTQALSWMRAGWKVEEVDLADGSVTFKQTDNMLYQLFFADLLARLKDARPGLTRATKTLPQNWWSFGAGRSGLSFGWVFSGKGKLRVELYIDTGDKATNTAAFHQLKAEKDSIEQEVGEALEWQLLENRQASRIAKSRTAQVTDPPDKLEQSKQWAVSTMLKFVDALQPRVKDLDLD